MAKPLPLEWFYDEVFHANYWVCVGPHERLGATLAKHNWPRDAAGKPSAAKTLYAKNDQSNNDVVLFWFDTGEARNVGHQLHESFHAASMVLQARGFSRKAILDETGAYYVEWVFNALRVALKKVKRG